MKRIIGAILAFFLCLLMIGNFLVILLNHTILNKSYILEKMDEDNYYEKIETNLRNGFENYQYQSGLPVEVFEGVLDENSLKNDIDSVISCLYDGTEIYLSSETVQQKLDMNIRQYLAENNRNLNAEEEKNVQEFEKLIVTFYEDKIQIAQNYLEGAHEILIQVQHMMKKVMFILLIMLVFLLIITLLVLLQDIAGFIDTIGIALLSAGVILCLVKQVVMQNIDIANLLIIEQGFSDFIKYIILELFDKFVFYGVLFVIIGLGAIVGSKGRKEEEK